MSRQERDEHRKMLLEKNKKAAKEIGWESDDDGDNKNNEKGGFFAQIFGILPFTCGND